MFLLLLCNLSDAIRMEIYCSHSFRDVSLNVPFFQKLLGEFVDRGKLRAARIVSLPGCYPTASQLALKPLIDAGLLAADFKPVIDAVSGVSGAGRKAKIGNAFCEVSLSAYASCCWTFCPTMRPLKPTPSGLWTSIFWICGIFSAT